MDAELIAEHAEGIIATTGCPSGEVQTRLRLGQYDEARGRGRRIPGHLRQGQLLPRTDGTRPGHRTRRPRRPASAGQAAGHPAAGDERRALRHRGPSRRARQPACASASARTRTTRTGSGSTAAATTSRPPAEMRELFRELPEACDNTLLIAERIESYDEVFDVRRPRCRSSMSRTARPRSRGCARRSSSGLELRYGDPIPDQVHRPLRDRDGGHRADGLLQLLPRRRRHLQVRARQPHPGRPRPRFGNRIDRRLRDPASPSSTRWSTACSSSASSTPSGSTRPTSTWTSTTASATRWSATSPRSTATRTRRRSTLSARSRPRPRSRTPAGSSATRSRSATGSRRRCRRT